MGAEAEAGVLKLLKPFLSTATVHCIHIVGVIGKSTSMKFHGEKFWKPEDTYAKVSKSFHDKPGHAVRITAYGEFAPESMKISSSIFNDSSGRTELGGLVPQVPVPSILDPMGEDEIKIYERDFKAFKPRWDLIDSPKQLVSADKEERIRFLRGLHERFWHNAGPDVLKLL